MLMSMTDDPVISAGPWPAPAGSPRHGPGGPGGHGGAGGDGPGGGGGHSSGSPLHRFRRVLLAVALGLGAFWAAGPVAGHPVVLTTAQIAARTDPGLADVVAMLGDPGTTSAGTGLVLSPSGEVLTNNHVIVGATSITVTDVATERAYRATVVGYDRSADIAVLKLRGASGLPTVDLGDSSHAAVGQRVVALGNAGGRGGTPSVAVGRITGLGVQVTAEEATPGASEHLTGLILTDAGIRPGDSGGPLVTTAGRVIGINTAASSGPHTATRAYAIPVNGALAVASQVEAGVASAAVHIGGTAFLGVQTARPAGSAAPAGTGAPVVSVDPGSPAARAGLAAGDVIVSVGRKAVSSPSGLRAALAAQHPRDRLRVVWTGPSGWSHAATVVLGPGPAG